MTPGKVDSRWDSDDRRDRLQTSEPIRTKTFS